MYIESVQVEGFWGRADARTRLAPGVNIFIGTNGSGKTTLINIINAILTADVSALINLPFTSVRIRLRDTQGSTRTLTATRKAVDTEPYSWITYKLGRNTLGSFPLSMGRYRRQGRTYFRPELVQRWEELQITLGNMVNVRWLSVHRHVDAEIDGESTSQHRPPVDAKLQSLVLPLTKYLLELEASSNEATREFQRQVILTMLYNREFDSFGRSTAKLEGIDLKTQKEALTKALGELGIPEVTGSPRISEHMDALAKSINVFKKNVSDPQKHITIDDILPLPLLLRTEQIVKLVKDVEIEKKEVFRKRDQFKDLVNKFFHQAGALAAKHVDFDIGGELQVILDKSAMEPVDIELLSSGEKQLLIQFIEVLLQKEDPCVFIADEPELSLHIEWQEKLLAALTDLNPNAQIIVATHSPEIVGDFADRVQDMAEVVSV